MRDNLTGDGIGSTMGAEPAGNRPDGTASGGPTDHAAQRASPFGDRSGGSADPGPSEQPPHETSPRESAIGALTGWWRDFAHAATFLTRIPFHVEDDIGARPLAAAARGFPIAGLVVGVVGAVALMTASALGLPNLAAALIAIAATAVVTGGLHEDGLADTIDGVLGGHNREETLTIMRDSRIGAFGTLALIFVIALKVSALEALDTGSAAAALIGAEVAGRAVLPAILFHSAPARGNGLSFQAGTPTREGMVLALLLGAVLVLLMLGIVPGVVAILVAAGLTALIIRAADARLGGHTGDVLGAAEQIVATAVLLVAAAVV
jgi:adenosylcobinamide-GDP ribazoletransferase